MKNFLRALRYAWPYRYRLAISVVCAFLAAVFWGLNFTAIYPVLKILGTGQNLQEWVQTTVDKIQTEQIAPEEVHVKQLNEQLTKLKAAPERPDWDDVHRKLTHSLAKAESKLESSRHESYRYQLLKKYIDALFPTGCFQTLALVLGLVVLAVIIKGFFEFWQESLVGHVVNRSLFDLRNRFYRKVLRLDVGQFNDAGSHELMSRFTNDMEILGNGMRTLFGKIIAEPLKAIACVVFACMISWQLTFMFLVLVPVALLILTRIGHTMKRATRRLLERMSNIYQILQETFQGIKVVKAFTRETAERLRFRKATKDYYNKAMWIVKLDALSGPLIEILGVAAVLGALLVGAYLVVERQTELFGITILSQPLEAESLLQLYALLAAISDPVRKLSSVFTRIQSAFAGGDRIFYYMDREPKVQANTLGPVLERARTSIEFREVCFSYDPGHPIITDLSLEVRQGEIIALVGKNGSGKSTLLGLLPRFYDPDHGAILIDGLDIRTVQLRSLRSQIGIVTQDTMLFNDTILANILYGRKDASMEEVEAAARQAKAHDFIVKLPRGYETRVGEAGTRLSGGQKQRIALARAILRDPAILILDEFTSQADVEIEMELHRVLREFMRGRTTFVITHRLNTLEIADRIVVLDGGRILAVGSHQELMTNCPLYIRLHEAHTQKRVA
ncbi:MAG: ABC transporter ATP-binding protein [Gemmataceae bacterium]